MAAEQETVADTLVVKYDVTEAAIAELRDRYKDVRFDTPAAYEEGRKAIGVLRDLRGKIERRRKDLKADSLAFGRKVDGVAKSLTALVAAIEDPLQAAKSAIDEEEARKKREAERAELLALEAKLKAEREEEERKAKELREAEEKRLAAERARIAEEQRVLDEQRRQQEEVRRQEDARLAAERAELARRQAEVEETQRAQREQQEAQEAAARAQEAAAAASLAAVEEAARLEALRPDIEKVHGFADRLDEMGAAASDVEVQDIAARMAMGWAKARLEKIAAGLRAFKGKAS